MFGNVGERLAGTPTARCVGCLDCREGSGAQGLERGKARAHCGIPHKVVKCFAEGTVSGWRGRQPHVEKVLGRLAGSSTVRCVGCLDCREGSGAQGLGHIAVFLTKS